MSTINEQRSTSGPIEARPSSPPSGDAGRRRPWTARLAVGVIRRRRMVMAAWLGVLLIGGFAAGHLTSRLQTTFSLPGQPGYETAKQITDIFGNGGETNPVIAVVSPPAGQTVTDDSGAIAAAFERIGSVLQDVRVVDYANTGDTAFITEHGTSTFALVLTSEPKHLAGGVNDTYLTRVLGDALPGYRVGTTGLDELASGGHTKGPGVLLETVIAGLGALAVLAYVFASLLALLPLVVAAVAIVSTLLVILGLTYVTDVSYIVQYLLSLIGLGVAIDYSLLFVTRWREERDRGVPNDEAVVRAAGTAGRSVALSGLTVAIGLLSLVVIPSPAIRSFGIGGMLIPLVSVAVVLTLLPALLAGVGRGMDWPHRRQETTASRAWSTWARRVVRRPLLGAGGALVVLGVLIAPVFGLKVGTDSLSSLAQKGQAHATLASLEAQGVRTGVLTPLEVLTRTADAPAVKARLAPVPGIATVALPAGTAGSRDGLTDLIAIPTVASLNNTTLAPVNAAQRALAGVPGVVGVAGDGPALQDFSHAVYGRFPLMFAVVALLTLVLLTFAFQSVVLAAKAVVLNLVSMTATFGFLVWFWQEGHGSKAVFAIPATGAITFWVPLMIFAFLFGLSMDYEVFILTRVREEYERTGSTTNAMIQGLARTGRLVTNAALILFLAFASLASAPITDLKPLATGLGVGILLDATIVRGLLVPALVALLGRWNWWMPGPLGRIASIPATAKAHLDPNGSRSSEPGFLASLGGLEAQQSIHPIKQRMRTD